MCSMSVTNVTTPPVQFKGKQKPELVGIERGEKFDVYKYETEASTAKKWGVGLASTFIPGLGQAINGDWGKGAAFFGTGFLLPFISGLSITAATAKKSTVGMLASLGLYLGSVLGIRVWSAVDAVKNSKSESIQIKEKMQTQNQQPQVNTVV